MSQTPLETADSKSPKLKVVHVVNSLDVGGMERILLDLARWAPTHGQDVTVVCLTSPGVLAPQIEALGARVISLGKRPGLTPRLVTSLRSVFRQLKPDIVHTHLIGGLLYAGPAAKREDCPVVVHTEHINNVVKAPTFNRRLRVRGLWWLAARYARKFFCVADDIAVAARVAVGRDKLCVVTNGIEVSAFTTRESRLAVRETFGIPADAPVIGTVGRLNEVKCQDLLIRAFADVRRAHPSARLLLVGDGPSRAALESLARELAVSECVHFAGYQPAPQRYLQAMDIFTLTSRIEGLPLAILEAWAARLPVIASRVGGIPKLIDAGSNGLLFESGDSAGLAACLAQILDDAPLAARLAKAGLDRVTARYSAERMAAEYQQHYLECLRAAVSTERACPLSATSQQSPPGLREQSAKVGV